MFKQFFEQAFKPILSFAEAEFAVKVETYYKRVIVDPLKRAMLIEFKGVILDFALGGSY